MMKYSRVKLLCPWVYHRFVKGNLYLDLRFGPTSNMPWITISIRGVGSPTIAYQLLVDLLPVLPCYILWAKIWMPHYFD